MTEEKERERCGREGEEEYNDRGDLNIKT